MDVNVDDGLVRRRQRREVPVEQSDGGEEEEKGEWFPDGIHGDQGPLAASFMLAGCSLAVKGLRRGY